MADVDDTVAAAKPNADPTPGNAASRRSRKRERRHASAGDQCGKQPPEVRRGPRRKVTIFSSCMGPEMPVEWGWRVRTTEERIFERSGDDFFTFPAGKIL